MMGARSRPDRWPDEFIRLLQAYEVSGPTSLAQRMQRGKSTVQNWASRGVPQDVLLQAHKDTGRSLEWLMLGLGTHDVSVKSDLSDNWRSGSKNLIFDTGSRRSTQPVYQDASRSSRGVGVYRGEDVRREHLEVRESGPPTYIQGDSAASVGGSTTMADESTPGADRPTQQSGQREFVAIPMLRPGGPTGEIADIAFDASWLNRKFGLLHQLMMVEVVGQSMEPTFFDGDLVLINALETDVVDGRIYVIHRGGQLLTKRVQVMMSGGFQVISDNPVYPVDLVPPGSGGDLGVVGRVVWPRTR